MLASLDMNVEDINKEGYKGVATPRRSHHMYPGDPSLSIPLGDRISPSPIPSPSSSTPNTTVQYGTNEFLVTDTSHVSMINANNSFYTTGANRMSSHNTPSSTISGGSHSIHHHHTLPHHQHHHSHRYHQVHFNHPHHQHLHHFHMLGGGDSTIDPKMLHASHGLTSFDFSSPHDQEEQQQQHPVSQEQQIEQDHNTTDLANIWQQIRSETSVWDNVLSLQPI